MSRQGCTAPVTHLWGGIGRVGGRYSLPRGLLLVSQCAPWCGVDWVAGLYSRCPIRVVAAVAGGSTVGRGRHGATYVRVGFDPMCKAAACSHWPGTSPLSLWICRFGLGRYGSISGRDRRWRISLSYVLCFTPGGGLNSQPFQYCPVSCNARYIARGRIGSGRVGFGSSRRGSIRRGRRGRWRK